MKGNLSYQHGQAGCCSSAAITHKPRGLTGHQGHPFTFTQPILLFSASCVKSGLVSSLAGASADCRLLVHRPGVCLPSDLSAEAGLAAVSCPANWTTLGCTAAVMTSLQFPPTGRASQHHGDSLLVNRQGAPRGSPLQELSVPWNSAVPTLRNFNQAASYALSGAGLDELASTRIVA